MRTSQPQDQAAATRSACAGAHHASSPLAATALSSVSFSAGFSVALTASFAGAEVSAVSSASSSSSSPLAGSSSSPSASPLGASSVLRFFAAGGSSPKGALAGILPSIAKVIAYRWLQLPLLPRRPPRRPPLPPPLLLHRSLLLRRQWRCTYAGQLECHIDGELNAAGHEGSSRAEAGGALASSGRQGATHSSSSSPSSSSGRETSSSSSSRPRLDIVDMEVLRICARVFSDVN